MAGHTGETFHPLNICLLTVSDTRSLAEDTSGDYLEGALLEDGHNLFDRQLCPDDIYTIRAIVSAWIADDRVQAILITGGTGFSGSDSTPEAVSVLFDKSIEGFGEIFRAISYEEIGTSTVQSRALAGMANQVVIFCMPGSTGACRTAWEGILCEQLDSTHKPCNYVMHLKPVNS
jgi:molybdenum cofactor biosynthesis protein B